MIRYLIIAAVAIFCLSYVKAIDNTCLTCICKTEGCEKNINKCNKDKGTTRCGPFQIKLAYWVDCGRPGGDYQRCTKQMACSERCVRNYITKYGKRCTKNPKCKDFAKIHNGGPRACKSRNNNYWKKVKKCRTRTI